MFTNEALIELNRVVGGEKFLRNLILSSLKRKAMLVVDKAIDMSSVRHGEGLWTRHVSTGNETEFFSTDVQEGITAFAAGRLGSRTIVHLVVNGKEGDGWYGRAVEVSRDRVSKLPTFGLMDELA